MATGAELFMLTIAQITDLHICSGHDLSRIERARTRLRQVLHAIMALRPRPVAIIASGDLADTGDLEAYQWLWSTLREEADLPIYPGLGNHDIRAHFIQAWGWPESKLSDGFVQYVADLPDGPRLVMCDTLEEGQEGAGFCQTRADWLKRTLDGAPDRPTLVVLHHPPVESGIQWMDPAPNAPWIGRLAAALEGQDQVRGLTCGHLHRPFASRFAGKTVTVSAATDIQLTLDLTDIDMSVADGREILLDEPPGFALHMWRGGALTTHFCLAGPYPSAVNYKHPFLP
jgi:3',5'-cyclic AMP phosphodiesterase CpdA